MTQKFAPLQAHVDSSAYLRSARTVVSTHSEHRHRSLACKPKCRTSCQLPAYSVILAYAQPIFEYVLSLARTATAQRQIFVGTRLPGATNRAVLEGRLTVCRGPVLSRPWSDAAPFPVRLQRDCRVGLRCRHRIWPCPVEHRDFSAARLRLLRYNHAAQNHERTMYPTHTVDHAVCGQSVPTEERRRTLYK